MTDPIIHAKKSPSKFERIMLCPGSQREEANYPDERGSPAAADGTHSHTLLEFCLLDETEPQSYLGRGIKDHDGEFTVDQERINRIKVATDYLRKRQAEIGAEKIIPEEWLDSRIAFGRDDMHGTCDAHMVGNGVLEVVDYKDGMGVVELPCPQLDIYTLLILSKYTAEAGIKMVRQTIIQPKLAFRGEKGVTYVDRTVEDTLAQQQKYIAAAALADTPDAPLVAGEKQCKYCKHKSCSERNKVAMSAMGFLPIEATITNQIPSDITMQTANKDPATMTGEQLKGIIEAAPLIRQLIEAAEAELQRRLEAGQVIDGIKLVRGRGSRAWAFDEEAMAEKLKKFGLPKDALWKTSLISPAQAEKVVWTKKDGSTKQLTDRQLKTMKEEYIKSSEGKIQVAAASDARPAVQLSVAGMFGSVTNSDPVAPEVPAFLQIPDFLKL